MNVKPSDKRAISGAVEQLFVKTAHGVPMVSVPSLSCVAGLGLTDDIHANRLSPRQVLVTLASELNAWSIAPGALFENLVIALDSPERFRPGAALMTGGGVEIRLTMFCEPCKRIASVVPDFASMINRRGVLGVIARGGEILAGDSLTLAPDRYPPLPESITQRFLEFVAGIPAGRVARYLDITTGMGVDPSFIRAVPGYMKRHAKLSLPLHRIVNAKGELPDLIPDQALKLTSEGVQVDVGRRASVDLARYLWRG